VKLTALLDDAGLTKSYLGSPTVRCHHAGR